MMYLTVMYFFRDDNKSFSFLHHPFFILFNCNR